jgi:hypothetical protein
VRHITHAWGRRRSMAYTRHAWAEPGRPRPPIRNSVHTAWPARADSKFSLNSLACPIPPQKFDWPAIFTVILLLIRWELVKAVVDKVVALHVNSNLDIRHSSWIDQDWEIPDAEHGNIETEHVKFRLRKKNKCWN